MSPFVTKKKAKQRFDFNLFCINVFYEYLQCQNSIHHSFKSTINISNVPHQFKTIQKCLKHKSLIVLNYQFLQQNHYIVDERRKKNWWVADFRTIFNISLMKNLMAKCFLCFKYIVKMIIMSILMSEKKFFFWKVFKNKILCIFINNKTMADVGEIWRLWYGQVGVGK